MTRSDRSLIALALVLAAAGPALAADAPLPAPPQRRVVVLHPRDFRMDPDSLFYTGDAPVLDATASDLGLAARTALARDPEVAVVSPTDLAPTREGTTTPELVVRGLLHLGQERYRDIRIPAAVQVLEKGVDQAQADFVDVLAPDLVSDLHLYLGLCYLEQGSGPLAHVAFKNLFFVTPQRRFRKGYFPPDAEAALHAAAVDFVRTFAKDSPLGSVDRAAGFLAWSRSSALVYVYLTGTAGIGERLEVRVLEGARKGAASLAIGQAAGHPWSGRAVGVDQVDRAVSGWLACTSLPSREAPSVAAPAIFLDTTAAYSIYLKKPTRRYFHHAGFGVGVAWQALEGLDVFGRVNLYNSFADPYGDLVQGFWNVRLTAGIGYSMRGPWGRVFLHTGLEGGFLPGFVATQDVNCKTFGLESAACQAGNLSRPQYLIGLNAALGVDVFIAGPIYLVLQAGTTAYFFSNESDAPLNFPMFGEIGLGYAFF